MSLTSTVDKTGPFLLTALPQTIPTGFPFQQGSDLLVLDLGPTVAPYDPARILVLGSDYTVTGGGYNGANEMQSGSVVVVSGGSSTVLVNDYIVIMRAVPINQPSSFLSTGPLTVALLEQALDRLATLAQQVNEVTARSLQFENFEFLSGILSKVQREGMLLGFNAAGQIQFTNPATLMPVAAPSYVINGTVAGITGLTGGGSANLDGYSAASIPAGTLMFLSISSAGTGWFLTLSSFPTGPLVVTAYQKAGYQWVNTI